MIGAAARGVKGGRLTSPARATKLSSATPRRLSLDARLQSVAAATPAEPPPLPLAAGADIAIQRHAAELAGDAPARPPHPDWLDEGKMRAALADSHRTKLFARGW
jgi:hypothetical protein